MRNFKKKYLLSDCKKYKSIIKDYNSIHQDKKINLYTPYEKPIIFGALIIEDVLKRFADDDRKFILNAAFKKPVFIGETIEFQISSSKNIQRIQILNNHSIKGFIRLEFISVKDQSYLRNFIRILRNSTSFVGNYKNKINLITNISIHPSNITNEKKCINVTNNLYKCEQSFKKITNTIFFINFDKVFKLNKINFRKVKLIKNFEKKNILLIGANSGIGQIFSNFFEKKKINFTGTFYKKKHNKISKNFYLDLNRINKKSLSKISSFDTIFFLSSPKIFSFSDEYFSYERFKRFQNIYIKSLYQIVKYLSNKDKSYKFFVPSSKMVEFFDDNFEYSINKSVQEKFIKYLKKRTNNISFYNPRLDAIYTNTTKTLLYSDKNYEKLISNVLNSL